MKMPGGREGNPGPRPIPPPARQMVSNLQEIMPCPGHCNEGIDCETCSDEGDNPCRTLCDFSKNFRLSVRLDKFYKKRFEKLGKRPNLEKNFARAREMIDLIENEETKVYPLRIRLLTEININPRDEKELFGKLEESRIIIEEYKKIALTVLLGSEADL
jgi:hypothetical protein